MRALAVACAVAACNGACGGAKPRPQPTPPATLEAARAAERGTGMPRDYERAAAIYDQLCAGGRGSIEACFDLKDAMVDGRGAKRDVRRIYDLDGVLCSRGEPLACYEHAVLDAMQASAMGRRDKDIDTGLLDRVLAQLAAACERGDGRACEATVMGGDSGSAEWDRRHKYSKACLAGRMDACGRVVIELDLCGEPEVDDAAGCEQRLLAEWRSHDFDSDLVADAQKLFDECHAGNAQACEHVPTQRIAMSELCAAHDYGACARLGCVGDDAAQAQAIAHGVDDPNCYVAGKDAWLEWKRAGKGLPPIVTDGQRPLGARPTPPWEAVRFQHHGGRDRAGWPRFDVYNMNDRAVSELTVCAYAYDGAGQQLARYVAKAKPPIAPDALVPLAGDVAGEPAFPPTTSEVVIDFDHVRFADATPSDDPARCPEQRAHDKPGAYTHW